MEEYLTKEQIIQLEELGCIIDDELVYGDEWDNENTGIGDDARQTWLENGVNESNYIRLYYQLIRIPAEIRINKEKLEKIIPKIYEFTVNEHKSYKYILRGFWFFINIDNVNRYPVYERLEDAGIFVNKLDPNSPITISRSYNRKTQFHDINVHLSKWKND